jgi:hypothetical protein
VRKLLLLSVLIATVLIPAFAAMDLNALRGLKRTLFWTMLFNAAYALAAAGLYLRM